VQFLSDPTGTRRWLPFAVESIESPLSTPFNHEGIYAQAYALYKQGFRYWFDRPEIERLNKHNELFQTSRSEYELIDEFFRKPVGDEQGVYLSAAVALQMTGAQAFKEVSTTKLGRAFTSMGYDYKILDGIRRYRVIRRSTAEQQLHREQPGQGTENSGEVW
jgi:predicted P-loop ATPase